MPKYQCPECEAILKRDTAVEEGKKIKCPKCEVIFKARALHETEEEKEREKKKAKSSAARTSSDDDDDEEEGGTYTVVEDTKGDDARAKDVNYGSLRDKFAKSKRGPAMAETVRPSNLVLMQGFIDGLAGLGIVIVALWPFIFSEEAPKGTAARNKILFMLLGVFVFAIACVICYGASKLQDLESYTWAMIGCILAIISVAPTGAAGGIWGIVLLKNDEIKDAFEETQTMRDY